MCPLALKRKKSSLSRQHLTNVSGFQHSCRNLTFMLISVRAPRAVPSEITCHNAAAVAPYERQCSDFFLDWNFLFFKLCNDYDGNVAAEVMVNNDYI